MKVCIKCKIEKELSEYNYYGKRYNTVCNNCLVKPNKVKKHNKVKKQPTPIYPKHLKDERDDWLYDVLYYLENDENVKQRIKLWENKIKLAQSKYQKKRRKTDGLFKMTHNLRSRTYIAFKRKSWIKNGGTQKMLGCDFETAHKHLERQFTKGMNWGNYGEWHIDHIIPLASANTENELIKLCHYTNLQPLWAEDNLSKSATIPNVQIKLRI